MKHLKTLGLIAAALAALMAFAGAASATSLTSPAGTTVKTGTKVHAVSEGHVVFDAAIGKIECNSTVEGKTSNENAASITITISMLNFTGCTTATIHVLKPGSLSITSTGGNKGSLAWTGAELTQETFGLHCIFTTNNTPIGTVTGSAIATSDATLDISANIPRTGGRSGAFCGSSAPWTGSYRFTSPTPLLID